MNKRPRTESWSDKKIISNTQSKSKHCGEYELLSVISTNEKGRVYNGLLLGTKTKCVVKIYEKVKILGTDRKELIQVGGG
jgi:hypothetical protein